MYILDVLGILIGFATVMLLLSLLVTGLVQAVQAGGGLRRRNLQWGLERVLHDALGFQEADARTAAKAVIETIIAGKPSPGAAQRKRSLASRVWNPAPSWIKPDELIQRLSDAGHPVAEEANQKQVVERFKQSEDYLSKRFAYHVRFVTIPIVFVIAAAFQISSIELLGRLSKEAEFRQMLVSEAEGLVADIEPGIRNAPRHQDVAGAALKDVQETQVRLNALKIELWPRGWAFFGNPTNILGVVLTGILLTFGAPFWFEMLGQLVRLKDVMSPAKTKPS